MDSPSTGLDFAVIGHQDSWKNITSFINGIRKNDQDPLSDEKVKEVFSFIPPRDLFRVNVRSKTGAEINGVYIDTFIAPDKLEAKFTRTNITKVANAASCAIKMGARIVALGGFTSIVLEGNTCMLAGGNTKFTTGNTLTAAYIVKGIEKAAHGRGIDLQKSTMLIVGATGDIGVACVNYFCNKVNALLLCARNSQRLEKQAYALTKENISVDYSMTVQDLTPRADIIICVASSTNIDLAGCKKGALVCDAGYPKNLETTVEARDDISLFHGGMGQVSQGFTFSPDYSKNIYRYPAPYIIHGCILEAMILAFEKRPEAYSAGKGNISNDSIGEIYKLAIKHGIMIAPFYNSVGLWEKKQPF